MPSLKSSSKGGTELTLFATERRQLQGSLVTCKWISEHTADRETELLCNAISERLAMLFKVFPEPEKS